MSAYDKGYKAFYDGYGQSKNPYYGDEANIDLFHDWIDGWLDAHAENERNKEQGSCYMD